MILHLYFMRKFLVWFGLVFAVFFGIVLLIDTVEQLRRFDAGQLGLDDALRLALLNTPQSLYRILPLLTVLATLGLFLGLARTSELIVTRSSGRSAMRSLIAPVATALILGGLAVSIWNPIVSATTRAYDQASQRLSRGEVNIVSIGENGLWLRQSGSAGQTVIRALESNGDGTELSDVTFLGFDLEAKPTYRAEAEAASLVDGAWDLSGVKWWNFRGDANAEANAQRFDRFTIASNLTKEDLRESFGDPSAIPIWDLPEFITRLEAAGFSSQKHRVWFWTELSTPLMLVAMVLIAAGFTMRHTRFGKTGLMILFALLLGFGIFFLRNFAQVLGENGQIPVGLAAWAPPLAGIFLSVGLLLHTEDG